MDLAYTFSGFLVGFIVGLTGVGGGSLMTPLLVLFFGIKPAVAVGTDLLYAALTKCGGIYVHSRNNTIKWKIVGLLSLGSLPASAITVYILHRLQTEKVNYENFITTTLGIALILTSLVLLLKVQLITASKGRNFKNFRVLHAKLQSPLTVLVGLIIGMLVTLSSVGAGAIGAATLFLLYPRLPAISIVGSDIAHAVPLTAIAGIGHLQLGTVNLVLLGSLLCGSLPGIYLGSHVGLKLPERYVRWGLAGMLMLIGVRFAL